MTAKQKATYLADKRGHTGQRRIDFITGFLIAHGSGWKWSRRQLWNFGLGRRNKGTFFPPRKK